MGVASAATPGETSVRARELLTAHQTLRGEVRFRAPSAWSVDEKSGVYTARFTREAASDCATALSASIRGKATRRTPAAQVTDAIGTEPLAEGARRDGRYGLGEITDDAQAVSLYGIAVVRVAERRVGQLRVFARFSGSGCTPEVRRGAVAGEVERVLRTAHSRLRVARSR